MTTIANDPRFVLVPKESDRDRLFDEYLRERLKKERESFFRPEFVKFR